ncbi:transcription initiation factor TFIID subunit 11 [Impatiens glandulifera]|uniref:transcription initiation factor TFIID subunit 11 n=1 Tax=Impatiens glandulifera TaxID=253017 RepID=UPI001FB0B06B|nr:transcription initiation factor TFIID subunit 11 [Impatiens glandulifera]
MKQSKDPFEVAFEEEDEEEEEDSPPTSPIGPNAIEPETAYSKQQINSNVQKDEADRPPKLLKSQAGSISKGVAVQTSKPKDEDEEEEEENLDVELGKFPTTGDPDKMEKMQVILSQFTEEQMSRYESFRRSGFQKANMKRLLTSITGSQKISIPMTIVVSGIAKIFVGELVETARVVMTERKESGPIRPCHIREAHRRLKLEGKVPKRSIPRLFR